MSVSTVSSEKLPKGCVLCPSASVAIKAPAVHVFRVLTDGATWPAWNSFCPKVEVEHTRDSSEGRNSLRFEKGAELVLHVRLQPDASIRKTKCIVKDMQEPSQANTFAHMWMVSWTAKGFPDSLLRAERVNEISIRSTARGEEECVYNTWEGMSGPIGYPIKLLYGQALQSRFEDMARDLKNYAEKTWTAQSSQEKE